MASLAVMLIATGGPRYTGFIGPLTASLKAHFPPHDVILFTDSSEQFGAIRVPQPDLGWPDASLMRYHAFLGQRELLMRYEHVLYMDVDMLACARVTGEELFSDGITAVIHPSYPDTFERRRRSTAYVEGSPPYYQGCLQGGKAKAFLDMCEAIAMNVDIDKANGIVAVWHDESHLNRYLSEHPPARVLTPAYAYPDPKYLRFPERWMAGGSPGGLMPKRRHLEKPDQGKWKPRKEDPKNILIAVVTCKEARYAKRLEAQERTWIPAAREAGYDVVVFDGEKLGTGDGYLDLPMKTKALCNWTLVHGYDRLVKCDDDTCINLKRFQPIEEDYAGLVLRAHDAGKLELKIPAFSPGTTKFSYAQGGIYWLSRRSMRAIGEAKIDDWAEDRWVGQVLGRAGIPLKEATGYHFPWSFGLSWNVAVACPDSVKEHINRDTVAFTQLPGPEDILDCYRRFGDAPKPPSPQAMVPPSRRPSPVPQRPVPIIMPVPGPQRPVQAQRPAAPQRPVPQRPVPIIMPVPGPQRPPPQRPPVPPPRPDWRNTILGAKVNHAVSRGFRVAAVCPLGSSYHMQLRKALPGHLEEVVETPQGKRVLFLVR
jgi:hypothetical protein